MKPMPTLCHLKCYQSSHRPLKTQRRGLRPCIYEGLPGRSSLVVAHCPLLKALDTYANYSKQLLAFEKEVLIPHLNYKRFQLKPFLECASESIQSNITGVFFLSLFSWKFEDTLVPLIFTKLLFMHLLGYTS